MSRNQGKADEIWRGRGQEEREGRLGVFVVDNDVDVGWPEWTGVGINRGACGLHQNEPRVYYCTTSGA